jgi:hypothetical protein
LENDDKIKSLAYRLWLTRRDRQISGDAYCDYYQAERILESYKNLKLFLLGSFGYSTVSFVLGNSPKEHFENAVNAVLELHELADECDISPELAEILVQPDSLQKMAEKFSRLPLNVSDLDVFFAPVPPQLNCPLADRCDETGS